MMICEGDQNLRWLTLNSQPSRRGKDTRHTRSFVAANRTCAIEAVPARPGRRKRMGARSPRSTTTPCLRVARASLQPEQARLLSVVPSAITIRQGREKNVGSTPSQPSAPPSRAAATTVATPSHAGGRGQGAGGRGPGAGGRGALVVARGPGATAGTVMGSPSPSLPPSTSSTSSTSSSGRFAANRDDARFYHVDGAVARMSAPGFVLDDLVGARSGPVPALRSPSRRAACAQRATPTMTPQGISGRGRANPTANRLKKVVFFSLSPSRRRDRQNTHQQAISVGALRPSVTTISRPNPGGP